MKNILFVYLALISFVAHAQSIGSAKQSQSILLSDKAEISLLTCGPGSELYSSFGHSAFRIRDPFTGFDKVYNYGTFDFDTPNFYGKFTKGTLLYQLSVVDTGRFLQIYHSEQRWVKGQVLSLQQSYVQKIYDFLENNALPQNRGYLYDYFFDNCSTRLYDVIEIVLGDKLITPELFNEERLTHRELMQLYLGNQPWGDFGIDLLLGSVIDRETTAKEYLFLPENVLTYFDALKIQENGITMPLVNRTENILLEQPSPVKRPILTPLLLFSLIGLLVIWFTRKDIKTESRNRWLDFSLFFVTGIVGLVVLLIWFATNHISAKNNLNFLWAFAPNLIISFYLLKKQLPNWVRSYSLIALILLGVAVFVWLFKIQVYSIAVLPILLFLGVRYYYLYRYTKLS